MQIKMDSVVKTRILMVCLGNICRSPLAEGIMRSLIHKEGLDNLLEVDSAGTHGLTGSDPDPRSIEVAPKNGIRLIHKARRLLRRDFTRFDHILVMDEKNLAATLGMAEGESEKSKVHLITKFDPRLTKPHIVKDPYYREYMNFIEVYEQLNFCCEGWLKEHYPK
jgi:protein-tyrosine phosphatase